MIFSAIVILFVLAVGYIWASKGFFSAMLQMAIVFVSGAIAFGLWETIAGMLMDNVTDTDMQNMVWGVSLLVPFAVCIVVLSVLGTALIRFNVKCDNLTNWIGGGVCGLIAAAISAGVMCLAIAQTKQGDEFLGYKTITWDSGGSIHSSGGLIFPVDTLTAGLYGYVSERSLSTETPLAKWRPKMVEYANALNLQPTPETIVRYTVKPGDIDVLGRYTVGENDAQAKVSEMLGDSKAVYMLDGTQMPAGSAAYIEAYVLQFKAGAREKSGQVSIMPGQFMLVLRNQADDQTLALLPIAVIANAKGDVPIFGRFRFDGQDVWLGSAGPRSNPIAALEFLIPRDGQGWRPIALYAKGVRVAELLDTSTEPAKEKFQPERYSDRVEVDNLVLDGSLIRRATQAQALASGTGITNANDAIALSNNMPGIRLNKSFTRGLELFTTSGKTARNFIVNGEGRYRRSELMDRGADRSLEVSLILPGDQSLIVQANVSRGSPLVIFEGDSADADGRMYLEDASGQQFDCVGYLYEDAGEVRVRFTPGAPVTKRDLPSMTRSRDDQKMQLVFRVASGVKIVRYVIGQKVIATFEPPIDAQSASQVVR